METYAAPQTTQVDRQDLAGIYDLYSQAIFRYAYRLLGDQDNAEECVAETFSRYLGAVRDGRRPENVKAYLYRIAHNWITDSYRRKPVSNILDMDMHADPQDDPEDRTDQNLEMERLREALRRLPAEQRLVVSMRFLEELSHDEVATILDKTVEATRALQHRAVAALRRMLIEQEE